MFRVADVASVLVSPAWSVNIASRLADDADEGEVIVSSAVRNESGASPEVFFEPRGARRLRGVSQPVEVYAARVAGGAADS